MTKYISACIMGVFVIDGEKVVDKIFFDKNPQEIARKLLDVRATEEFQTLHKDHKVDYLETDFLKDNLRKLAVELKFVKNQAEFTELMSKVNVEMTKTKISLIERRDRLIIHTVSALNDMDRILNYMTERLREWYGLHYPEHKAKDLEKFAEAISTLGRREKFEDFTRSMGMELRDDDIEMLQKFAEQVKKMFILKKDITKYLEKVVPEEIPNLNALLGSVLAARLIANAGSLEKLAKMPSSKLQLIGAEKALFKYLKGDQQSVPKYGIIFTHPDISGAAKENQGKVARLLSSKLTIAARADFYTKKDISKTLVEEYKKKVSEIK